MCQFKVKVTIEGQLSAQGQGHNKRSNILTIKYYTLCRVRSLTPLLMEGFSSNLNDTFTLTRGCAEPMFFSTTHITLASAL